MPDRRPWLIGFLALAGVWLLVRLLPERGGMTAAPKAASAPGAVPTRAARRVLLLGMDGLDWKYLDAYMAEGLLPHFSKLKSSGTGGPLFTMQPPLSPILWTTMATGRTPDEHGVLDFFASGPDGELEPVPSTHRKVPALWDMLDQQGDRTATVAWYATWPPTLLKNGTMISDRISYHQVANALRQLDDPRGDVAKRVYPPELAERITEFLYDPEDAQEEVIYQFFLPTEDDRARVARKEPVFYPRTFAEDFTRLFVTANTVAQAGLRLWEEDRPDAAFIYFEWIDATKHLFADFLAPRAAWVRPEDFERYQEVIQRAYMFQDTILGEYMAKMDENTVLLVVSDHGWKFTGNRLPYSAHLGQGYASEWHDPEGVYMAMGPGIAPGARGRPGSVLDVTPTVLALRDLPAGEDMKGKRLPLDAYPPERPPVASWDATWTSQVGDRTDLAGEEEYWEKLVALGYVDPGKRAAFQGVKSVFTPKERINLALYLQSVGRNEDAIAQLREAKATSEDPVYEVDLALGAELAAAGKWEEAADLMAAWEGKPSLNGEGIRLLVEALARTGRVEEARARFDKVLARGLFARDPLRKAELQSILGREEDAALALWPVLEDAGATEGDFGKAIFQMLGNPSLDERELARVIALGAARDPGMDLIRIEQAKQAFSKGDRARAYRELDAIAAGATPFAPEARMVKGLMMVEDPAAMTEAAECFRKFVELRPGDIRGHLNFGTAMRALKRPKDAEKAYEAARKLEPRNPALLALYGKLMLETGRATEGLRLIAESLEMDPDQAGLRDYYAAHGGS